MNFGDIQDRVKFYILDEVPEVTALVPVWINEAMRAAENRFSFLHMQAEQSYTTTEGNHALGSLPDRFKRPREHPYRLRDDGDITEIDLTYDLSHINRRFNSEPDDGGKPLMLFVDGNQLKVYPAPDGSSDYSDGDYRIHLPFWQYTAELSSTSDTNWWTDNFPFYLIYQAASEGLIAMRDPDNAAPLAQKAQQEYRRARVEDGRERVPENMTLRPRQSVYSAGRRPRRDIR